MVVELKQIAKAYMTYSSSWKLDSAAISAAIYCNDGKFSTSQGHQHRQTQLLKRKICRIWCSFKAIATSILPNCELSNTRFLHNFSSQWQDFGVTTCSSLPNSVY